MSASVMGNSMGGMHVWLLGREVSRLQWTRWCRWPASRNADVGAQLDDAPADHRLGQERSRLEWRQLHHPAEEREGSGPCSTASRPLAARSPIRSSRPTRAAADKMLDDRLAAPFNPDANDFMYQWEASGDFDPTADLPKIKAKVSRDQTPPTTSANPPETGLTEAALKQVKDARLYLIPASHRDARVMVRPAMRSSTPSSSRNSCRKCRLCDRVGRRFESAMDVDANPQHASISRGHRRAGRVPPRPSSPTSSGI